METIIIECSKASAEVVGTNRWTNQIGDGVVINAGDVLSVEGIAINSIGVGGDIIEIPTTIQPEQRAYSGTGTYASNKQSLIVGIYIHFTGINEVPMPLLAFDYGAGATPIPPGPGPGASQAVDGIMGAGGIGNPNYGYLLCGTPIPAAPTFPLPATGIPSNFPQFIFDPIGNGEILGNDAIINNDKIKGQRFYMITSSIEGQENWRRYDVETDTIYATPPSFSDGIWDYATMEMRFGVNTGYDSPENIANIINKDINETQVNYYNTNIENTAIVPEVITNLTSGASVDLNIRGLAQLQTTKQSIASVPTNWNGGFQVNGTGQTLPPTTSFTYTQRSWEDMSKTNANYNSLCVLHPERMIAGYNLMSLATEKGSAPNIYGGIGATEVEKNNIVCMAYPGMPTNGLAFAFELSKWVDKTVLPTNLKFTAGNLEKVKKYLLASKNLNYDYLVSTITPNDYNLETILKDEKNFYSMLDVGRILDGQFLDATTGARLNAPVPQPHSDYLNSWIMKDAVPPITGYGAWANALPYHPNAPPKFNKFETYTYFDDARYKSAILPPGTTQFNYKIVDEAIIGGTTYQYKEMAVAYNIAVVALEYSGTLVGTINDGPYIGFILRELNQSGVPLDLKQIYYGDYCVFDPAMKREGNESVKIFSSKFYCDVVDDATTSPFDNLSKSIYSRSIQLGANNPTMSFDEGIGRFGLSNLYFGLAIGNDEGFTPTLAIPDPVGVADAENEILKLNCIMGPGALQNITAEGTPASMLYARSGLGIVGYKMYNIETGLWEQPIDDIFQRITDSPILNAGNLNIERKSWWKNSLLNRIGFEFDDLFPRAGGAPNLFQRNTYNKLPNLLLQELNPLAVGTGIILDSWNSGVKPLTLNPYFATSLSTGYSTTKFGLPMFDLEYQRGVGFNFSSNKTPIVKVASINIDTTSDSLFASNLPQKLSYPYWLVYSDLIGGVDFIGDRGKKNNIMAVANRAYTSGDFAFNFATDYVFTATTDFVISQITTEILNPDYSEANIDEGTIILYKVQRQNLSPAPTGGNFKRTAQPDKPLQKKQKQKKGKY